MKVGDRGDRVQIVVVVGVQQSNQMVDGDFDWDALEDPNDVYTGKRRVAQQLSRKADRQIPNEFKVQRIMADCLKEHKQTK